MANRRSSDSRRKPAPVPAIGAADAARSAVGSGPSSASAQAAPASAPSSRRRASAEPTRTPAAQAPVAISAETRRAMIAEAAYLRAERRGFVPGGEEGDWLAAEKEVDALLSVGQSGPQ